MFSLPPTNEVCKGYIFTGVCLSIGGDLGLCPRGSLTGGVSVQGDLCLGWGLYPGGFSVQGVSVQGSLCPGGSLSKGVSVHGFLPRGSLSKGVSVQGVSVREIPAVW